MDVDNSSPSGCPPRDPQDARSEPSDPRQRLDAIEHELSEVFWDLFAERRRSTGIDGATPSTAPIDLHLRLSPPNGSGNGKNGRGQRDTELWAQLRRAAEHLADRHATFPAGRVYCYWSKSFDAEQSTPPDPRCVFGGYRATGQPLWPELTSVLLERRDPRIDLLYHDTPALLTVVQGARELRRDQLATWGRRSSIYRILGQVVAGYFVAPARDGRLREPYAVTFQAVQGGHVTSPVFLNVVGQLSDGTPAREILEESSDRLWDAVAAAQRQLAEIRLESVPRRRRHGELMRRTMDTLRRLSRHFERIFRQRGRRTLHARDRHRSRRRPTSKALEDALGARSDTIYRDVEEHTWIVVGPRNRVHVFNDAGAHVTSVVYPGETVRHRTTKGKWQKPRAEELDGFRAALRQSSRPA